MIFKFADDCFNNIIKIFNRSIRKPSALVEQTTIGLVGSVFPLSNDTNEFVLQSSAGFDTIKKELL